MFIVLWVVMGVLLGGCAGLLLIAGLQLSRNERDAYVPWSARDNESDLLESDEYRQTATGTR